jgi:acyl dehydratase
MDKHDQQDRRLDLELEQTFPASDAIPWIHEVNVDRDRDPLYLEDFSVGDRFVTGSVDVKASDIKFFASRFDPQPFHLDEAAAAQSLFGGLAASGWHTAAMTMSLIIRSGFRIAGGLVGVGGEITWPRPVRPGDVLRVETEVLEVTPSRSKPGRGIVTVRNETVRQDGERVQIAVMKLMVPRKGR